MHIFIVIFEAFCIASALSADAFVTGFSYGTDRIKIPFLSVLVIDGICSLMIGATLLAGSYIRQYTPAFVTTAVCFTLLFVLGMAKLLDGITKSLIRKYGIISSNIKFSFCNFRFVLSLYANPACADTDHSKTISPKEAIVLAIVLSLDGCAVGFGAALGNVNGPAVFFCSLIMEAAAILSGAALGNRAAKKLSFPVSWLSGCILLILAFSKLIA